ILEHKLPLGRGFNYDNWGGYLRYRFGIPVFIDDRADFYGEKFYLTYANIYRVEPNWDKVLDQNHILWVLVQKKSCLAAELKKHPEWPFASSVAASDLFGRAHFPPDREPSH